MNLTAISQKRHNTYPKENPDLKVQLPPPTDTLPSGVVLCSSCLCYVVFAKDEELPT